MKKATAVIGILLFFAAFLSAQDYKGRGRMKGRVTDETGRPLEGVSVKLFHTGVKQGFQVQTNAEGIWVGTWVKGGTWNIDFEKTGFLPVMISSVIKETERNADIETRLERIQHVEVTDVESLLGERLDQANDLYKREQFEHAMAAYEGILKEFPDAHIIQVNIGNCLFQMGKYEDAIGAYLKAHESNPDNPEIRLNIGNSYANMADHEKAREWYDSIGFEKIHDVNVLYNIGTDFYALSEFQEAFKYFQRAVELKSNFLDGIYQLGLTSLSLGNNPSALEAFEKYLQLDRDSERADQVRNFIAILKK